MLKIRQSLCLAAAFLMFLPLSATAYNANDYNSDHVPYNFDAAVGRQLCQDEMAKFDSDYNAIAKGFNDSLVDVVLYSGIAWSLDSANNLFEMIELYYSTEFKDCIKADDERIEEEAKQERFQKAVDECDFDFFENEMTDKERMDTYDERMACKEEFEPEVRVEEEPKPILQPEPVYVPPVVSSVVAPEPVTYKAPTTPTPAIPVPVTRVSDQELDTSENNEVAQATTSTSTPKETIEMTKEELNQLVEQRVNEALGQSEPEAEKPSLFKKVWNFLFGWW